MTRWSTLKLTSPGLVHWKAAAIGWVMKWLIPWKTLRGADTFIHTAANLMKIWNWNSKLSHCFTISFTEMNRLNFIQIDTWLLLSDWWHLTLTQLSVVTRLGFETTHTSQWAMMSHIKTHLAQRMRWEQRLMIILLVCGFGKTSKDKPQKEHGTVALPPAASLMAKVTSWLPEKRSEEDALNWRKKTHRCALQKDKDA